MHLAAGQERHVPRYNQLVSYIPAAFHRILRHVFAHNCTILQPWCIVPSTCCYGYGHTRCLLTLPHPTWVKQQRNTHTHAHTHTHTHTLLLPLLLHARPERKTPHSNDSSIMAESKVELLTDSITPSTHHFVTGSVPPPRAWSRNMTGWQLQLDGEVDRPMNFTMEDLQGMPQVTRQYVLECASNWGRGMLPATQQADWWSIGGVSCSEWTGVLLKDVLAAAGVKASAVYIGWYGEDDGPSRGIPIEASEKNTRAWQPIERAGRRQSWQRSSAVGEC